jgi:hypothetical protein
MHHRKLSNKDWIIIEEKFQKKLSSWKGKMLSVGGRLVLIYSVLTSLAMYMLSFFEFEKGFLENWITIAQDFIVLMKDRYGEPETGE